MNYDKAVNRCKYLLEHSGFGLIDDITHDTLQTLITGVESFMKLELAIERAVDGDSANAISDEYRILTGEVMECVVCEDVVEPGERYGYRWDYPDGSRLWTMKHIDELHADCFNEATDEQLTEMHILEHKEQ